MCSASPVNPSSVCVVLNAAITRASSAGLGFMSRCRIKPLLRVAGACPSPILVILVRKSFSWRVFTAPLPTYPFLWQPFQLFSTRFGFVLYLRPSRVSVVRAKRLDKEEPGGCRGAYETDYRAVLDWSRYEQVRWRGVDPTTQAVRREAMRFLLKV